MQLSPGSHVTSATNRTYTVNREISKGGFGIVHLGKTSTGRKIVIKEPLKKGDTFDSTRVEKLKIESEILKKLSHNNIVKYIDECFQYNNFYLVIEYIEGKTLFDVARRSPMDEEQAKRIIITVLDVLSYLHQKNIIHRDIKPQNILDPDQIKVIDFGAAKEGWTQWIPYGHTQIWTPGWSAPEQQSGYVSPKSDLYALGATMFYLLTGEEMIYHLKRLGEWKKKPREINRKISREIEELLLKALQPLPNDRYDTAEEMTAAIRGKAIDIRKEPSILLMGKKYPIHNSVKIGRMPPCDVIIQGRYISRQHAEIYKDSGKYWVRDLNSRNGTWIIKNNQYSRITQSYQLQNNDTIALCYDPKQPFKGAYVTFDFFM